MEEHVPRAPWRRRRSTDSPRPAGRRWAGRLRRSGTIARQALTVRVGRRRAESGRVESGRAVTAVRYMSADLLHAPRPAIEGRLVGPLAEPAAAPVVAADAPASLLPGEHTVARRLSFALVNACTLASLGLGMVAIFLAMRGDARIAAAVLVACVIFDGLDGALARRLGVSSPFGAQMDSLADMCSFGLAAPVVVYASVAGSVPTGAAAVACGLVAACAMIRLARFNVSPKDGRFFCGVPTTMAAAVLALSVVIGLPVPGTVLLGGVALLAIAMVSSFPYAKVARLVKLPPWLWLVPLVGAFADWRLTFVLLVAAYLASGPLLWLRAR
jgi:CDP-diacylglycerol--serine O-phosphatidyltransferase